MKKFSALLFLLSIVVSRAETLDDFLSTTLLGQGIEKIEQSYDLDPNTLKEIPAYIEISEFQYEGLTFKVNVFCRSGECKSYGVWKRQLRNKDKNGRLKHGDNAEIHDVFQLLLRKLIATYGQAPRAKFESISCGCGCASGPLSQSYTWVNEEYALVFMFHDNVSTQSITLRQYRRDEKNGEFRGEAELSFFENLYKNQSGKLPDDWPSAEIRMKIPQENKILDDHPDTQLGNNKEFKGAGATEGQENSEAVKEPDQEENPSHLPWIIAGVVLVGILLLLLKVLKGKSTP